jgi:hypothetical protein
MVEIVNLSRARKAQARTKARAMADENAVKFGRTRAQKTQEQAEADKARAALDAHARETE